MDCLNAKAIDEFRVNACEAITFKLIRKEGDLKYGEEFHPEYTHQIFGDNEQIFGYRKLQVNIFYLAGSLTTYIGTSFTASINPKISKGVLPDDVFAALSDVYPYKFERSLTDFIHSLNEEEKFRPFGTNRHNYHLHKNGNNSTYCIYFIEHGMPNFNEFLAYHKRMESFLLFFVDGASSIPTDDKQWCYYVIYEKIITSDAERLKYAFIGYMTVYKFYAYPENLRPRVSQVLILPPFRNNGHATQLLQIFYRDFIPIPNVRDITVEDPSVDFQRLRDFLDCKRALELPELLMCINSSERDANPDNQNNYLKSADRFRELARQKLKLNRCQARRIYEILYLYLMPRTQTASEAFKKALSKRFGIYFQRVRPDAMRGSTLATKLNVLQNNPLKKAFDEAADEYFSLQLREAVDDLMESYKVIVDKLDHAKNVSERVLRAI